MNHSHYPSLELCKKLTAIGFPKTKEYAVDYHWDFVEDDNLVCPSVMEMLDVMPIEIKKDDIWYMLVVWWNWCVQYYPDNFNSFHIPLADFRWNIPNALAEMILWLHENDFVSFS